MRLTATTTQQCVPPIHYRYRLHQYLISPIRSFLHISYVIASARKSPEVSDAWQGTIPKEKFVGSYAGKSIADLVKDAESGVLYINLHNLQNPSVSNLVFVRSVSSPVMWGGAQCGVPSTK
jgi:hypothetical protein